MSERGPSRRRADWRDRVQRARRSAERLRAAFDGITATDADSELLSAGGVSAARDAVDLAALDVPGGVPAWQRAQAAGLLLDVWAAGQRHGVSPRRWSERADLAAICLAVSLDSST